MFCPHCATELTDDAIVCVGCGKQVTPLQKVVSADSTRQWVSGTFALLIILTFLFPPGGLVAGIYSLFSKPKRRQGIIILAITAFWLALVVWFVIAFNYNQ